MKCPICNQEGYSYQHELAHDYMDEWRLKTIKEDRKKLKEILEKEWYKEK